MGEKKKIEVFHAKDQLDTRNQLLKVYQAQGLRSPYASSFVWHQRVAGVTTAKWSEK